MALETWTVMVGLSLMALWYNVEQSPSVKPIIQGRHEIITFGSMYNINMQLISSCVCTLELCVLNPKDMSCLAFITYLQTNNFFCIYMFSNQMYNILMYNRQTNR